MNLIIGKNSNLILSIKHRLNDFDFISHQEIHSVNLLKYDTIFLFSWSYTHQADNLDLLSKLPLNKLVFISSTSVFSLMVRKQWGAYPNNKFECENIVLSGGGRILRLGVCNTNLKYSIYGRYQFTSLLMLVNYLTHYENIIKFNQIVVNLYCVENGELNKLKTYVGKLLRLLSLHFPNYLILQFPFFVFAKMLKIANYSYTGDTISCCQNTLQVGYGAFGSFFYKRFHRKVGAVVTSTNENISLNQNGFKNTMVGKNIFGLSSLWHGVYFKRVNDLYQKKILFMNRILFLRKDKHILADVDHIEHSDNGYRVFTNISRINIHPYYKCKSANNEIKFELNCDKIILAAGPFENARLLQSIEPVDFIFDDHELALLGELNLSNINPFIKKIGPFVYAFKACIMNINNSEILLDFRPYVRAKTIDSLAYYNKGSVSIIYKLFTQFNYDRLNEAFYNRFKISFATDKFQVYGQYLVKDCIKYYPNKEITRKRVTLLEWSKIQNNINLQFPSFNSYIVNNTIDAIHSWSSINLDNYPTITKLINSRLLTIFGSPNSSLKLSSRHHTHEFRKALLDKEIDNKL
jgi:hypothetical protein